LGICSVPGFSVAFPVRWISDFHKDGHDPDAPTNGCFASFWAIAQTSCLTDSMMKKSDKGSSSKRATDNITSCCRRNVVISKLLIHNRLCVSVEF
jgi:hypothetical protein